MAKNYAENYPKIIYKYRSWANEYHRNILLKNQVYLSSPIEFNDPFDCKIPKNFLLIDSPEKIEKYVNENREEFAEEIRKQLKSADFRKNIVASFLQAIVKCTESEWKMPIDISFEKSKEDDY